MSCVRMDDFEVYLRQQSYESKLFRVSEKFVARLKWVAIQKKHEVFKEGHIFVNKLQQRFY